LGRITLKGTLLKWEQEDPELLRHGKLDQKKDAYLAKLLTKIRILDRGEPPLRDSMSKKKRAELDELLAELQSVEDQDPAFT
jgi:hypothetical protein